jgi:hypothetical protein
MQTGDLSDPVRLWLGKSHVPGRIAGDVFEGINAEPIRFTPPKKQPPRVSLGIQVGFGGIWGFYRDFWRAHDLDSLRFLRPEIAVQPNDTLILPLRLRNDSAHPDTLGVSVILTDGWRQKEHISNLKVPAASEIEVELPVIAPAEESSNFTEIRVNVLSGGSVTFQGSVFARVSRNVAEQVK